MKRREFIALIGGAAAPWPAAAWAQQAGMPAIGYLYSGIPEQLRIASFLKGLSEAGYVEGRNVTIEYRFANNDIAQLQTFAADLVHRQVAVIATPGSLIAAAAAKTATTTIPIVFMIGADPVETGLVESLNRPGGNITGVSGLAVETGTKRLGMLHDLLPKATRFALLVDPASPSAASLMAEMNSTARGIAAQLDVLTTRTVQDIDAAVATIASNRSDALLIGNGPLFFNRRVQLSTLAARHAIPSIYPQREFVEVGGLMSYGASSLDQNRQAGIYVGRVLKGEKPGDLPILRATKFEFLINQQTARTLGIEVPATLLAQADEVIE